MPGYLDAQKRWGGSRRRLGNPNSPGRPGLGAAEEPNPLVSNEPGGAAAVLCFASFFGLTGLAMATLSAVSVAVSEKSGNSNYVVAIAALGGSVAVLSYPHIATLTHVFHRRSPPSRSGVAIFLRTLALIVYATAWLHLTNYRQLELVLPLSGAAAGDLAQAMWMPDGRHVEWSEFRGSRLAKSYLVSLFGLGALAILLHSRRMIIICVLSYAVVGLAILELRMLTYLQDRSFGLADRRDLAQAAEHKRRSDWMHDEVISLLTGVQMKFERQHLDAKGVSLELGALDHQLRLRQSEEALRSGAVTLGDLLQPYLRFIENLGARVTEAPAFESASCRVGEYDGRRVQRVFGVTIPNAVAAGASEVAIRFRLDLERSSLVVEVEDDAGGFDWTQLRAGGGLDTLRRDVGPECMTFESAPSGTRIVVNLSLPTMVMT